MIARFRRLSNGAPSTATKPFTWKGRSHCQRQIVDIVIGDGDSLPRNILVRLRGKAIGSRRHVRHIEGSVHRGNGLVENARFGWFAPRHHYSQTRFSSLPTTLAADVKQPNLLQAQVDPADVAARVEINRRCVGDIAGRRIICRRIVQVRTGRDACGPADRLVSRERLPTGNSGRAPAATGDTHRGLSFVSCAWLACSCRFPDA